MLRTHLASYGARRPCDRCFADIPFTPSYSGARHTPVGRPRAVAKLTLVIIVSLLPVHGGVRLVTVVNTLLRNLTYESGRSDAPSPTPRSLHNKAAVLSQ
jgi:hypothetical protein